MESQKCRKELSNQSVDLIASFQASFTQVSFLAQQNRQKVGFAAQHDHVARVGPNQSPLEGWKRWDWSTPKGLSAGLGGALDPKDDPLFPISDMCVKNSVAQFARGLVGRIGRGRLKSG